MVVDGGSGAGQVDDGLRRAWERGQRLRDVVLNELEIRVGLQVRKVGALAGDEVVHS